MTFGNLRFVLAFAALLGISGLTSCAHEQQLTSISIQPATETFGASNIPVSANAGSTVQLRALGAFIHPPVTKDVTNEVVWNSNTPDIATVDAASGLLTAAGLACGNSLVSATVQTDKSIGNISSSGAIVTGYMTATVVCFVGTGPVLSVAFAGTGAGTVSSSPGGLGCAANCSASFPAGTTVTLTATPNGSTFGGWTGCDTASGQTCTVALSTVNRSVTVTFN